MSNESNNRKQDINSLIRDDDHFDWSWGKYVYWETNDVIKNDVTGHKFYCCRERVNNFYHSSHLESINEMDESSYEELLSHFYEWLEKEKILNEKKRKNRGLFV